MASPAYRFIDGALYRRHTTPYAFDLRIHDLGGGHNESLVLPRYGWSEVDASERCLADAAMSQGHIWDQENGVWVPSTVSAAEQAQKDADNKERSVRRARTKVRRLIKSKDLNTMLTLTYRENMVDRARMQRDFDVFMKRVEGSSPAFNMSAFLSVKAWCLARTYRCPSPFESLRGEGCDGQVLRPSEDCLAGCCGGGKRRCIEGCSSPSLLCCEARCLPV